MSKGAQRFEVFTDVGKRRDWPPEVKASIVAMACRSEVAHRLSLSPAVVVALVD